MIRTFIINKYLSKEFIKVIFNASLIFFCLGIIMNMFEEINFFKDFDVGIYIPITLSLLYVPSLFYNMFPFIILLSGLWFFLKIKKNRRSHSYKCFRNVKFFNNFNSEHLINNFGYFFYNINKSNYFTSG